MTPGEIQVILHRLDDVGEKLDGIDMKVERVEAQATLTNGRVSELEIKARIEKALSEHADVERHELMIHKVNRGEQVSTLMAGLGGAFVTTLLYIAGHALHWI